MPLLNNALRLFAGVAALGLLAGCHTYWPKPDETYAATLPEEQPPAEEVDGAIFHTGHDVPLFENTVAHRVGDVLTIILQEQTQASKSATTTTKKTTTEAMAAPTLLGAPLTVHGAQRS